MKEKRKKGVGMALGIAIGAALGVALDNIAAWMAIGIALGAGFEYRLKNKNEKGDED
jgi:hypothetical protein